MELLGIVKIMCDAVEVEQADSKFDSPTIELSSILGHKENTDIDCRTDNLDAAYSNSNMSSLFQVQHKQRGR